MTEPFSLISTPVIHKTAAFAKRADAPTLFYLPGSHQPNNFQLQLRGNSVKIISRLLWNEGSATPGHNEKLVPAPA